MKLRAVSAMSQRVEDGLGIATLTAAVLQRLPTHLSWRVDPTSIAQKTLVESLLSHLGDELPDRKVLFTIAGAGADHATSESFRPGGTSPKGLYGDRHATGSTKL